MTSPKNIASNGKMESADKGVQGGSGDEGSTRTGKSVIIRLHNTGRAYTLTGKISSGIPKQTRTSNAKPSNKTLSATLLPKGHHCLRSAFRVLHPPNTWGSKSKRTCKLLSCRILNSVWFIVPLD